MVWTISRYYNTEERLLPLLSKIQHQICQRVRSAANVNDIFERQGEGTEETHHSTYGADLGKYQTLTKLTGVRLLEVVKEVLEKWKSAYYDTRAQIENNNKEAKRWEFDKRTLFSRTDFMLDRIENLLKCVEKINQFDGIISTSIIDVTGDLAGVRKVNGSVKQLPQEILAYGDEIWDPTKNEEF